jgi:hypothetical protein
VPNWGLESVQPRGAAVAAAAAARAISGTLARPPQLNHPSAVIAASTGTGERASAQGQRVRLQNPRCL